ncbi:hypothetical protein HanXRQr2_Chr13g0565831 [Helianthus annuus]|uniref:Uncharacterized protein n=1 Tax=Helianthus annuus TaxID=4232 RepID=A0A9K3EFR7_HELAN|nr:hypothetical protein HanXRQr2_Chr13g0565831 [Helianthus annuus]KAJ0950322.1 hypothetical protein HanPSC8_Chr02g0046951 [Helianthus annuus]
MPICYGSYSSSSKGTRCCKVSERTCLPILIQEETLSPSVLSLLDLWDLWV